MTTCTNDIANTSTDVFEQTWQEELARLPPPLLAGGMCGGSAPLSFEPFTVTRWGRPGESTSQA